MLFFHHPLLLVLFLFSSSSSISSPLVALGLSSLRKANGDPVSLMTLCHLQGLR